MYTVYSDLLMKAISLPSLWVVKSRIERDRTLTNKEYISLMVELTSAERQVLQGRRKVVDDTPWYMKLFGR
jgi:hypothetical protein